VFRVSQDALDDETLHEEDFGGRSHIDVFWHPDPVVDARLDPPDVLLVDPKLTCDLGEHIAVLALGMVAGARRRLKYIGPPAVDYIFAHELEVEGFGQVPDERRVLLLLLA